MKLKQIISAALSAAMLVSAGMTAFAAEADMDVPVVGSDPSDGLYSETVDMTEVKPDGENGVVYEQELENGDYTITVTTGGKTETNANIYINGGERVRAYTLDAGKTQENPQPVVITDGKLKVQVLGDHPNVTEIKIEEIAERTEPGEKPTLYIAGDSTAQTYDYGSVYPQTGWGQVFDRYFNDDIIIDNRSMGGRSTLRFDNDGRLDAILTAMKPGDYLFIQFGINDADQSKPERYISVDDYKKLLTDKYIGETEKRGGIPVLMTPTSAAWWDEENNNFMESRQDYADPTRELAKELGCKFIDANRIITDEWNKMDKDDVLSGYFICEPLESKAYPTGTDDHTHLKEKGAKKIAELIADAIPNDVPELAKYLKTTEKFTDISGLWAEDIINELAAAGVVQGDGNGKFNPDGEVTRAEFLKMVMEASDAVGHAYREGECIDASGDDWFCNYLQGAVDNGLILPRVFGLGNTMYKTTKTIAEATDDSEAVTAEIYKYEAPTGTPEEKGKQAFRGNDPITREAMASLLNTIGYRDVDIEVDLNDALPFSDAENICSYYKEDVAKMVKIGAISGNVDGSFAPKATLTRAQAAKVIGGILHKNN